MLKLKYLYENSELARECLKYYDCDEENTDDMFKYIRVSSNAIYPFRTTDGRVCFLRYSPAGEKRYTEAVSEIRIIDWLISRGFPAMKPFHTKDGSHAVGDTVGHGERILL